MATTRTPVTNPDHLLVRGIAQRALTASIFNYTGWMTGSCSAAAEP